MPLEKPIRYLAPYKYGKLPTRNLFTLNAILISCVLGGCATPQHSDDDLDSYSGIGHEAVAYSKNGVIGKSINAKTQQIAVQKALQNCYTKSGKECYIWRIDDQLFNNDKTTLASNEISNKIVAPVAAQQSTSQKIISGQASTSTNASSQKSYIGTRYVCSELNRASAYKLMNQGHSYLDRDGDGKPCEWDKKTTRSSSSNCHWVSGYRRKSGTYVRGHSRCR